MTPITVNLNDEEVAALRDFLAGHPRTYSAAEGCRLLIRDALIGMGVLAMPAGGRSKWARKAARK